MQICSEYEDLFNYLMSKLAGWVKGRNEKLLLTFRGKKCLNKIAKLDTKKSIATWQ